MSEHTRKSALGRASRIAAVAAIEIATIAWAAWYMYGLKAKGKLLGVARASEYPLALLGQNVVTSLVPILVFLFSLALLKKDFPDAMALRLRGKKQRSFAAVLALILIGITVYCLAVKPDRFTILYNLFYYLVIIAFEEEFVTRGVCVYLLRDEDWPLRYLLPNLLFGLMHLFSHADFGAITADYVLKFLFTELFGLAAVGCLMQYIKEKSGTLWLPVLLHTLMDYSVVLRY